MLSSRLSCLMLMDLIAVRISSLLVNACYGVFNLCYIALNDQYTITYTYKTAVISYTNLAPIFTHTHPDTHLALF